MSQHIRMKTAKPCEVCKQPFYPWRSRNRTCSHSCRSKLTAKMLGKGHYKRLGKAAWTPEVRSKRQSPRTRSDDYILGYGAGWKACERFYRKVQQVVAFRARRVA